MILDNNVIFVDNGEEILHYGVKRRSGRYPWGSGEDPYQHSGDFLSRVQELKKQGMTEKEIVNALGLDSTTQLRVSYAVAKNERRAIEVDKIKSMISDGKSVSEIGRELGKNESTIRSLLDEKSEKNMNQAQNTANVLKEEINNKKMIDVGAGVEHVMGVTRTKLDEALFMLEAEGYHVYGVGVQNVTNKANQINTMVLCDKDIGYGDAYKNKDDIQPFQNYYSKDGGETFQTLQYPSSISKDRVEIRYADKGGIEKDGVIEIRKGVDDLDLGGSHHAQVRIMVDGTHFLKGMAIYTDDIPDGKDIIFNTNKMSGTPFEKVLKPIKDDPSNPFGALIKANGQSTYIGKDGKEHLSAINKLKEEGDWDTMSKTLSSQFLSKQPMHLINQQLGITYDGYKSEYDKICSLTNPTIKKKMLLDFADNCDSAVTTLKAAALPRQSTKVILPVSSMKDTEVYAPTYKDGERVCLVRFPHGGTFEIPELVVNNRNSSAKSILGNSKDAIGINSKVAERLSGADFDGDYVTVIPVNDRIKIKTSKPLEGLIDFDPKIAYSTAGKTGVKLMPDNAKQKQMGIISNLITDMTLGGAPPQELERAVRHSMVVIDAVKHELDYKQSERDNGIAELKQKWQRRVDPDGTVHYGGASTLLSRRKQTVAIDETQGSGRIDPITGKVTFKTSGRTYVDKKTGEIKKATKDVKLLNYTDNLHTLSSGTPQEKAYADYGNRLKSLASKARITYLNTGKIAYSPSAKKEYSKEVEDLNRKLKVAAMNAPRERAAQIVANSTVRAKKEANPGMDKSDIKKASQIAITDARNSVGATGKKSRISITDREWEAIQKGAITESKLNQILRYTDSDAIRQRATPRERKAISAAQVSKIQSLSNLGYTIAEIADRVGVSTSSVSEHLN